MMLDVQPNIVVCHLCPHAVSAGDVRCAKDGKPLGAHADAGYCADTPPRYGDGQRPEGWESVDLPKADPPYDWTGKGPDLWRELHGQAMGATDPATFARYVRESFSPRVPCGKCRKHWWAILKRLPPEAADPFAWSVDAHNAVNVELAKPVVSLEEARRLHEPTEGEEGDDRRAAEARSIDN